MSHTPFIKAPSEEGKEKHTPTIEVGKAAKDESIDVVRVIVGKEVAHPNTKEHYIAWVELYGEKKDSGQVVELGRAAFTAAYTTPNARFQVANIEDFSKFHALSYCNLHGVWANTLER